jgi:hypothetical protein
MLAAALSSVLLAVFYVLDVRYRARPAIYVGIVGLLALPTVNGLLQALTMRGLLRRSTLWGALTGGGMVIAAATVIVMTLSFHGWPLAARLAFWITHMFGFAQPPVRLVSLMSASVSFGLILGAMQAIVLMPRWWSAVAWVANSVVGAVLAGLWLYAWRFVEPVSSLLGRVADSVPLTGQWRYLPAAMLGAEVAVLCLALPTGLLMQHLLRRYRSADAEALVRQFD